MILLALALSGSAYAEPLKFLDAEFMALLCEGWNTTSLPGTLGRNGSGWIDGANSPGKQTIRLTRRDCTDWPLLVITLETDAKGDAMCSYAGLPKNDVYQWAFAPNSLQWADFPDGFGAFQMPGLMGGFEGPYGVAMNNIGNFGTFFALAGKVAIDNQADWTCDGANNEKVAKYVSQIKIETMEKLAK